MKTFKSILSAVLSVIIFISGFVFIAAGILNYTLFNVNFYTSRITDNEYSDILYNSVSEEINKRINTIQISQEGVMSVIDKNELNRMSESIVSDITEYILHRTEYKPVRYENKSLKETIEKELNAFAAEHNMTVQEGSVDEIYKFVTDIISSEINLIHKSYLDKIPPLEKYVRAAGFYYIFIIITAICSAAVLIINRKNILKGLYAVLSPLWIANCAVFIPAVMFSIYDFPPRIALAESPLKLFISNTIYGFTGIVCTVTGVILTVLTLALAANIFFVVRKGAASKRRRSSLNE